MDASVAEAAIKRKLSVLQYADVDSFSLQGVLLACRDGLECE